MTLGALLVVANLVPVTALAQTLPDGWYEGEDNAEPEAAMAAELAQFEGASGWA